MGLRATLLESVDERRKSWLLEFLDGLSSVPAVSESAFVRNLIETVLALGAHGECIIVGRGAAQILPAETTLRARLVAPLSERIATKARALDNFAGGSVGPGRGHRPRANSLHHGPLSKRSGGFRGSMIWC